MNTFGEPDHEKRLGLNNYGQHSSFLIKSDFEFVCHKQSLINIFNLQLTQKMFSLI